MRILGFGVFLIFLTPGSVWATALDTSPGAVYLATLEACDKVPAAEIARPTLAYDRLYAGIFPSEKFNQIINSIKRESTYRVAVDLNFSEFEKTSLLILNNPGFERALAECYPASPTAKEFFYESIRRADRSGRYVGVFLLVVVARGAGAGLGLLRTWSVRAYNIINTTSNGLMALTLTSFLHSDTQEQQQVKKQFSDLIQDKMLDENAMTQLNNSLSLIEQKARHELEILQAQLVSAPASMRPQILEKIKRLEVLSAF